MPDRDPRAQIEDHLSERLFDHLTDHEWWAPSGWTLDWDPASPDDDPCQPYLATAPDGTVYEVEVEVSLRARPAVTPNA